jgi:hypothetical protein
MVWESMTLVGTLTHFQVEIHRRCHGWPLVEEEVEDGKLRVHRFQEFQRVRHNEEQVSLLRRTFEHLG